MQKFENSALHLPRSLLAAAYSTVPIFGVGLSFIPTSMLPTESDICAAPLTTKLASGSA
jgi:hypothetical protein